MKGGCPLNRKKPSTLREIILHLLGFCTFYLHVLMPRSEFQLVLLRRAMIKDSKLKISAAIDTYKDI